MYNVIIPSSCCVCNKFRKNFIKERVFSVMFNFAEKVTLSDKFFIKPNILARVT